MGSRELLPGDLVWYAGFEAEVLDFCDWDKNVVLIGLPWGRLAVPIKEVRPKLGSMSEKLLEVMQPIAKEEGVDESFSKG